MENESVKELQGCLVKEVNYDQEYVTGYFGNKTKQAVTDFQEKYKEEVLHPYDLQSGTGIVGPSTRKKLTKSVLSNQSNP